MVADPVEQAEPGGVEKVGVGAAFDEASCGPPLRERDRVVEWGAAGDDGTGGFDVGSGVQQRVESFDVVAAGGPMKRGFGMRSGEPSVDMSAGLDQGSDSRGDLRVVAGPVGGYV